MDIYEAIKAKDPQLAKEKNENTFQNVISVLP